MVEQFSNDFRVLRVCLASAEPMKTLRELQNGEYSIITFLDMIEMLDAQTTMQENAAHLRRVE